MPAENFPEKIGSYQIVSLLGRGGMGAVYKAFKPPLTKRFVAVKTIKAEFISTPGAIERFRREAALAAELRHPNIVTVFDYEEVSDGDSYIVTELIEGGLTLKDRLQQGNMSLDEISTMLKQVASALDYAYDTHHIVHRDIKPSNIFVDGKRVALGDFGIAKDVTANTQLTSMGEGVGTPDYMSPEQAMGEPLDRRSDIYSLAIMAFEMLTGSVPFKGDTPISVVMGHIQKPVPSIRSINPSFPVALEAVLSKALSKKREDRYATASDFAGAFESAAKGLSTEATMLGASPSVNNVNTASLSPQDGAVSQGLNLVTMLEGQGRYQDAFDQLTILHTQYPQATQITSRYQSYANQGYQSSNANNRSNTGTGGFAGTNNNMGGYAGANYQNYQGSQGTPYPVNNGVSTVTPPPNQYNNTPYPTNFNNTPPKKGLPIFAIIGGIVLVAVVAVIAIIALNGSTKTITIPTPVAAVTPTSSVPTTTNVNLPTPLGGNFPPGGPGGPVKQNGYVVGITAVEKPPRDSLGNPPKPGNAFVMVNVVIGSEKDSGISANPLYAQMRDERGTVFSPNVFPAKKPTLPTQNDIPKGSNVQGWVMFEVPIIARLVFVYNPVSNDKTSIEIPLGPEAGLGPGGKPTTPPDAQTSAAVTAYVNNDIATVTVAPGDQAGQLNTAGNALFDKGDYQGAADKYLQAVKLTPSEAVYHNNLGLAYINLGKYDLAENEARLAISLDPTVANYHNNLGVALDNQDKSADAENAYRDAIKLNSKDPLYHNNLAGVLVTEQKYNEAVPEAQVAISLDSSKASSYFYLGKGYAYQDSPNYTEAEKAFRKAAELAPTVVVYNTELAITLYNVKKYTEGEQFARKALSLDPKDARSANALGLNLDGQKKYKEAGDAYKQATVLNPKQPVYFANWAEMLDAQKMFTEAQTAVQSALDLNPDSAYSNAVQGDIFYDQKNYKDALTSYQKAIDNDNQNAVYLASAGDCYYQLQDKENAKKYYEEALKIDPNNSSAQSGLKNLGG
jgi:serine/threonine-protein kinase